MTRTRNFLVYHLPVILYAGVIITLSSIPNLKPPPIKVLAADKLAHFIEYGIFSFLAFKSFSVIGNSSSPNRTFLFAALFVCIFAVIDEYYQRFVPGRYFDIYDILTDLGGALIVLVLLLVRMKRKRRLPVDRQTGKSGLL